jgi:mannose-1-phosphate guanylyltransferase/mannose-6-phosphate isomerase
MHEKIYPVILCGGQGVRLWPYSRKNLPKQLLPLISDNSLFQDCLNRVSNRDLFEPALVIANHQYRFTVAEQIQNSHQEVKELILEPEIKDTAAAIIVSAIFIYKDNSEANILVLPSDHFITHNSKFEDTIKKGIETLKQGKSIVTFGITPNKENTNYGYFRVEKEDSYYEIKEFIEKPSLNKIKDFKKDKYFWNSGILLFKVKDFIEEIKSLQPDIYRLCELAVINGVKDTDFFWLSPIYFKQLNSISIDYAILEKTSKAVLVHANFDWKDLGTWQALWEVSDKDDKGNVFKGKVITSNVNNSYIKSDKNLVVAHNIDNKVIIATHDSILIADLNNNEELKSLTKQASVETENEITSYRPWGKYEVIEYADNYKVKRISVKPGGKLSLQFHCFRAEHWIITSGKALVTKGDETLILHENQSIYIPKGMVHRLENIGENILNIIEVQTGKILTEEDIIRLEDIYNRDKLLEIV